MKESSNEFFFSPCSLSRAHLLPNEKRKWLCCVCCQCYVDTRDTVQCSTAISAGCSVHATMPSTATQVNAISPLQSFAYHATVPWYRYWSDFFGADCWIKQQDTTQLILYIRRYGRSFASKEQLCWRFSIILQRV